MCDIGDSIFFTETPILEKFFSTLERGAINYCIVCLRTENERLLVRPQYFMRFARAMKIEKYWKHNFICNYCERQAYLAVRFYTATRLSASVDTIFAELLYQKKRKVANVFSERQFRNVLWSCDVENKNATPAYYEKQLRKIHYAADYAYQKAVVIDNFGIHIKDPIGKMTKTVECRGGYKQTVTRVVDRDRFGQLIKQADVGVQTDITMDTMVISEALVDKRLKDPNPEITEKVIFLDNEEETPAKIRKLGPQESQRVVHVTITPQIVPDNITDTLPVPSQQIIPATSRINPVTPLIPTSSQQSSMNPTNTISTSDNTGGTVQKVANPQNTIPIIKLIQLKSAPSATERVDDPEKLLPIFKTSLVNINKIGTTASQTSSTAQNITTVSPITSNNHQNDQIIIATSNNNSTLNAASTSITSSAIPNNVNRQQLSTPTLQNLGNPQTILAAIPQNLINTQNIQNLRNSLVNNTTARQPLSTQQNNPVPALAFFSYRQNIGNNQNIIPTSQNNINTTQTSISTQSTPTTAPMDVGNPIINKPSQDLNTTSSITSPTHKLLLVSTLSNVKLQNITPTSQNNNNQELLKILTQNAINPQSIPTVSTHTSTTQNSPTVPPLTFINCQNNGNTQNIIPTSERNLNPKVIPATTQQNTANPRVKSSVKKDIVYITKHKSINSRARSSVQKTMYMSRSTQTTKSASKIISTAKAQNNPRTVPINPRAITSGQNTPNLKNTNPTRKISTKYKYNLLTHRNMPITTPTTSSSSQNIGNNILKSQQNSSNNPKMSTAPQNITTPSRVTSGNNNKPQNVMSIPSQNFGNPQTTPTSKNIPTSSLTNPFSRKNAQNIIPTFSLITTTAQTLSTTSQIVTSAQNIPIPSPALFNPPQSTINQNINPTLTPTAQSSHPIMSALLNVNKNQSPTNSCTRHHTANTQNVNPTYQQTATTAQTIPTIFQQISPTTQIIPLLNFQNSNFTFSQMTTSQTITVTSEQIIAAPQNIPLPPQVISVTRQNNMPTLMSSTAQQITSTSQITPTSQIIPVLFPTNFSSQQNLVNTRPTLSDMTQTRITTPQEIIPASQVPPAYPKMVITTQNITGTSNNAAVIRELIPITSQNQAIRPEPITITSQTPTSSPVVVQTHQDQSKTVVSLEKLLQTAVEMHTGLGVLMVNASGVYTIHPITIKEGVLKVPSLQAFIKDGFLVSYTGSPMLLLGQEEIILNHISQNIPKTGMRPCPSDVCVQLTNLEPNQMLPGDKKVDWEDKIPMGLIAYMDNKEKNVPSTPKTPMIEIEVPKKSPKTWHHPY
ncbi:mucin-4-like isoform X1 [Spodoptera frugiperda]|uniref:Mucin-4-like isoform X1 n=1 Tax=Spodoptera frugiperda TaxID=7108 RepID=A0A9R0F250_SPOFR|nr:mucin-4-like isoform X1 [Spodoptera frugiperda]